MPDTIMPLATAFPPLVKDHRYLRHGNRQLTARIFTPAREGGPFPCLIALHGGSWSVGRLQDHDGMGRFLAARGFAVVALSFRQGRDAYPSSLLDINYGIRWVKANAASLNIDPECIAIGGPSTGGHLAMLVAMRPHDARYAAIPLPAGTPRLDASVRAVAIRWPMINPLSRYRTTNGLGKWLQPAIEYWQTEANAADGNPMLILARGEKVALPRAIWIQRRPDPLHDYRDPEATFPGNEPERFVDAYQSAGGEIELACFAKTHVPFAAVLYRTHQFLRDALA
ncbi:MAG: alpha/beta hydrolase [Alphaproteobacteria bacterium]|nr:alpha/beta hydrolase [Alphaproteobacteria bacterium]MBV9586949.1 alpha/beta hydrolase [Alphaproteobacteria bacterium]MBV9965372.1 alpha/beta hydrolase [Alphaproteobacteria bacterium]